MFDSSSFEITRLDQTEASRARLALLRAHRQELATIVSQGNRPALGPTARSIYGLSPRVTCVYRIDKVIAGLY